MKSSKRPTDIIKIEKTKLGEIPCFYIKSNYEEDNKKTVIYYHGWSSDKKSGLFIGKILAFHGYGVILPDAIFHGERNALKNYDEEAMKRHFWDVVLKSIEEYNNLTKEAYNIMGIDKKKIAVMGNSMGGFIASGVFANNNETKCLINMNGACAFQRTEEEFIKMDKDGEGGATKEQIQKISGLDPIGKMSRLYPRPILMLHGDADTSVPIDIQRYFYNEVKDTYKDKPERLRFVESAKLDHYKTTGMLEESIEWLIKYM